MVIKFRLIAESMSCDNDRQVRYYYSSKKYCCQAYMAGSDLCKLVSKVQARADNMANKFARRGYLVTIERIS